jgi:tripartite ATP-independent transporter DctP family solute receptor
MLNKLTAAFVGAAVAAMMATGVNARVLKVNESLAPGSPEELALKLFKSEVEKATNGDIEIRIFLQDQLGKPQQALENLSLGTLDVYSGALSYYSKLAPDELGVIALPYLFKDHDHLRRYLKGDFFKKAQAKLLEQGIRFLSTDFNGDRGPYRVYLSTKPIFGPDDLVGHKMRMWPNEIAIGAWKHLGAVPSVIPWTEVYLSIRQGVVNAVTAPLSLVRSTKFTEVAPYVTELKQFPQSWPITISEKVWQTLEPAQQKALVDAANKATAAYRSTTYERVAKDVDWLIKNNNAVFIRVNTDPFQKKMLGYYEQLIKEGKLKREVLDAVNALR